MQTITKHLAYLFFLVVVSQVSAQENNINKELEAIKEQIKTDERDALKLEIEAINDRLEQDQITFEEAEQLKQDAAEKRALNIENRIAIAANRLEFNKRNNEEFGDDSKTVVSIKIGEGDREILGVKASRNPPKYDIRTSNQLVFAMGFNNAIIDGVSLDDSPYKLGGSGFVELGWLWNTRVFENSNALRFKYGFSFQWNKLDIKDNQFFQQIDNVTTLETFPSDLKKAKFRTTNLVVPVHFEFGPWNKKEYKDGRVRYFNHDKFKIGLGGYAGVALRSQQKLVYEEDGERVKQKIKRGYNTNTFVYGLSAYVGVGDLSLYAKYDLSPIFKNQAVEQNNISLGIRVDLD
ncbi:coiled-coil domain-containing protein [Olleya aquimaris]|uniref:Outer membrane protein with beta-barrel domain n=1 Tax=Olleya aquimaris TaxID=639310 RepID=A0A327RE80_9FLAO|nr:hypothetical protein [Olleya aquimaris]RAJ14518.1 hypothetical protein LY08_01693 [Olleya aquimaris]